MSLLELRDLGVAIVAAPILTEVSLSLDRGEILGLVGESGAGKSMTALAILGLQPGGAQITGRILLDGDDLTQASDRAMQAVRGRRIGMVFQEPMTALDPLMSIGDQVAEPFRIHDQGSRTEARVAARALLDRVGLDADRFPLGRYPHELSGGERQRVAIAMAIALQPDLIIADEPTSALDVINQRDILDLLKRLVREDGAALLLISHDLSVVVETADRVAVMKDGSLLEQAAVSSTFKDLTHPYSLALVKAAQLARRRPARSDADTPPVLSVQGVTRDYSGPARLLGPRSRLRAVDDVSFDLKPGESLGLVGESGCGKSTLLRAILALEPVQAGQVMIEGQDITRAHGRRLTVLRRRIQMVFQDPSGSFDPRWKVHRLVGESLNLLESRPDPAEARRRVDAALEQVGLSSSDGDRFAHAFSGGQRQRIAIARALITEPAVLALDEAVSALDVQVRARILDLLADLSERLSLAYLFVTHDLAVARAATDRVLVMQAGRIVEHGPTEAVFSRPVHAYTRRLLAATPNSALTEERPETPS